MDKEVEVLIEAAEQLQALKATLLEQQGSSARLRVLADTLQEVASQIAKIPSGLSLILERAETVEQRIIAAAKNVEVLSDGIPEVVRRIESSDVGKSVDVLVNEISGSRDDLKAFRNSIFSIDELAQQFRLENDVVFKELREDARKAGDVQEKINASLYALRAELLDKLDGLEKKVVSSEQWSEKSIGATGKAFEVIATALKGSGERQSEGLQKIQVELGAMRSDEIAEMRKELKIISSLISQQGNALEALSKKKGFSF